MKKIYLVQYQITENVATFENRMKLLGSWIKYFNNSWLVESELTAEKIYEKLSVDFKEASIIIIEIKKDNYFGRMNTSVWDYLKLRK